MEQTLYLPEPLNESIKKPLISELDWNILNIKLEGPNNQVGWNFSENSFNFKIKILSHFSPSFISQKLSFQELRF